MANNNDGISDGLLDRAAEQAIKELANSNWHEVSTNALLLVCHAVNKSRDRKIVAMLKKPLYILATLGASALVWSIIRDCFGIGV